MNKKIILKYTLIYIPFIVGVGLYSNNIYNLPSSLLFFAGGYIALKNTVDYRRVEKNINKINLVNCDGYEKDNECGNDTNVIRVTRKKRNIKVRKRVKD